MSRGESSCENEPLFEEHRSLPSLATVPSLKGSRAMNPDDTEEEPCMIVKAWVGTSDSGTSAR